MRGNGIKATLTVKRKKLGHFNFSSRSSFGPIAGLQPRSGSGQGSRFELGDTAGWRICAVQPSVAALGCGC
jgi:hypothetical protein